MITHGHQPDMTSAPRFERTQGMSTASLENLVADATATYCSVPFIRRSQNIIQKPSTVKDLFEKNNHPMLFHRQYKSSFISWSSLSLSLNKYIYILYVCVCLLLTVGAISSCQTGLSQSHSFHSVCASRFFHSRQLNFLHSNRWQDVCLLVHEMVLTSSYIL